MKILPLALKGVLLIEPDVFRDSRGFFLECYHQRKFKDAGLAASFVQDNHSRSGQGTLRGLHAQLKKPQGKLVRAIQGEIFDVAVDARPQSPSFGSWVGERLSSDNFQQLYIPPGFLHGFCVLSQYAEVEYKCTEFYDPQDEIGVLWDDRILQIQWPVQTPILSTKDKGLFSFDAMKTKFESYRNL